MTAARGNVAIAGETCWSMVSVLDDCEVHI